MRRLTECLLIALLALAFSGCGTNFPLPNQSRIAIPSDKSYQMEATWTGMTDLQDILLTQGTGTQLFLLFNHGGTGTASRGEVYSYARLRPTGSQTPLPNIVFHTLFNPVALASGGDGAASASNRIFVLDRGDSCLARQNVLSGSGSCRDTTKGWTNMVGHLEYTWRVREYGLLGGDTLSTFTDTTMATVTGVAADAQGRVYVAGASIDRVPDSADPRLTTRTFVWRVNRYVRGPRAAGDPNYSPGSDKWHLDTGWQVRDGSGMGTVVDPRGIYWGAYGGGALYTADFGKSWVQKISDATSSTGILRVTGAEEIDFVGPLDVVADLQGFIYLVDSGNQRVLRFDSQGTYVQKVNLENDAFGHALVSPITVAADDSLVFVGDSGLSEVIRYRRRP